ncbi:unnamed protein product [Lampetra fluviatilis]
MLMLLLRAVVRFCRRAINLGPIEKQIVLGGMRGFHARLRTYAKVAAHKHRIRHGRARKPTRADDLAFRRQGRRSARRLRALRAVSVSPRWDAAARPSVSASGPRKLTSVRVRRRESSAQRRRAATDVGGGGGGLR